MAPSHGLDQCPAAREEAIHVGVGHAQSASDRGDPKLGVAFGEHHALGLVEDFITVMSGDYRFHNMITVTCRRGPQFGSWR